MHKDPLLNKPAAELTVSERAELARRYKLPAKVTPERALASARKRSAARRASAAENRAPADRRPIAAAALEALLRLDAVARADGKSDMEPVFAEMLSLMPAQYEKAIIKRHLWGYRDDALEKVERERAVSCGGRSSDSAAEDGPATESAP